MRFHSYQPDPRPSERVSATSLLARNRAACPGMWADRLSRIRPSRLVLLKMRTPSPAMKTIRRFLIPAAAIVTAAFACSCATDPRSVHAASSCINRLREIQGATLQWAVEHNKGTNEVPKWDDI